MDTNITRTWLMLLRTANAIKKMADQKLKNQFGISISQFDILAVLARSDTKSIRAGDLSRQLIVSDGNTTQVISKLVRDGFVLRKSDPKDARAVLYTLSPNGTQLFKKMANAHQKWLQTAFGDMSEKDTKALYKLLGHLPPHIDSKKEAA